MDYRKDHQSSKSTRKRSRSPEDRERDERRRDERQRSRSPYRHKHHHEEESSTVKLPFKSQHLHKQDLEPYKALFGEYLDLQKGLAIERLDRDEVKGRWKSFLGKWNRGELAAGWYDPETKKKADSRYPEEKDGRLSRQLAKQNSGQRGDREVANEDDIEDDDDFGPHLPHSQSTRISGPAGPTLQDLQYKRELAAEDRDNRIADLRHERKQDRKMQKERLEELVPRADPGSRERQLEKKRDTAASNRGFAEAKESGMDEVGDGELLGDDGGDAYKTRLRAAEKVKNEREVRKEEVLRARAVEREQRLAEHRVKEEKTMDMLRELARQRFGGGE